MPHTTSSRVADRLQACFTGVIFDVLRDLGLKQRVLPRDIRAVAPSMKVAGPVFTVRGRPDDTIDKHTSLFEWAGVLSKSPAGHVIVCQPQDNTRALFGGLSAEALKIKGARGYIVDGGCRDADAIVDLGFPVFTTFYTPIDIVGAWRAEAFGEPISIGGITVRPDDYVLADRDGIVLVDGARIDDVLQAAEAKIGAENGMLEAIRRGEDPQAAYLKHRLF